MSFSYLANIMAMREQKRQNAPAHHQYALGLVKRRKRYATNYSRTPHCVVLIPGAACTRERVLYFLTCFHSRLSERAHERRSEYLRHTHVGFTFESCCAYPKCTVYHFLIPNLGQSFVLRNSAWSNSSGGAVPLEDPPVSSGRASATTLFLLALSTQSPLPAKSSAIAQPCRHGRLHRSGRRRRDGRSYAKQCASKRQWKPSSAVQ